MGCLDNGPGSLEPAEDCLMTDEQSSIAELLNREVVLDTAGPATYLGTLTEIQPDGYWLENADFRDRGDGHVTKDMYVCEAKQIGIQPNRRRLFVFAHVVISIAALDDVIIE
jgi:hypothetical protein